MTAPTRTVERRRHPRETTVTPELRDEVLRGLLAHRKTLPPKLFYDATGAELFERITNVPEYYVTRAELEILNDRADEIAAFAGPNAALIEYGSGAGVKIRILLEAMRDPAVYVPIDISAEQLSRVAREIGAEYPGLKVHPIAADYTRQLELPELPPHRMRLGFFPGSTIGNFHPDEAAAFLKCIRQTVGDRGALVLGVDRIKDTATLNAAYDDAAGVTAAFNLNMLRRLNRELDADFDLGRFAHHAFFNARDQRVEMHIVSLDDQTVNVGGFLIPFAAGETIWTESSYKYDRPSLDRLAAKAGFTVSQLWTDKAQRFWVVLLVAR